MFAAPKTYAKRRDEICRLVEPMNIKMGNNAFNRIADDGDEDEVVAYKLDRFMDALRPPLGNKVEYERNKPTREKLSKAALGKDDFKYLGQLGDGQFGRVTAVLCKFNSAVYAMKSVKKMTAQRAGAHINMAVERKIHILANKTNSRFAPFAAAAFHDAKEVHIVFEYAPYGTLWDVMWNRKDQQAGQLTDDEIRWWAVQMALPIEWLHTQGFVHRDIKPHNFLVFSGARLKLTDFGSAAAIADDGQLRERNSHQQPISMSLCVIPVGTPDYIAPEVLEFAESATAEQIRFNDISDKSNIRNPLEEHNLERLPGYGTGIDWWSYGVTLYEIAHGTAPFLTPTVRETYERIMRCGSNNIEPQYKDNISSGLRSLLRSLIIHHKRRIGTVAAGGLRVHPFFIPVNWDHYEKGRSGPNQPAVPFIQVNKKLPKMSEYDEDWEMDSEWISNALDPTWDQLFDSTILTRTSTKASIKSLGTMPTVKTTTQIVYDMSVEASGPMNDLRCDRWCGWTWFPPSNAFDEALTIERPMIKQGDLSMVSSNASFTNLAGFGFATPAKNDLARTMPPTPRSTMRFREQSDRRVMKDLVECVQLSAKKRTDKTGSKFTRVSIPGQTPFDMSHMSKGFLDDLERSDSAVVDRLKGRPGVSRSSATSTAEKLQNMSRQHARMTSGQEQLRDRLTSLQQMASLSIHEPIGEEDEGEQEPEAPRPTRERQVATSSYTRSRQSSAQSTRSQALSFRSRVSENHDVSRSSRERTGTGGSTTSARSLHGRKPYEGQLQYQSRYPDLNPFEGGPSDHLKAPPDVKRSLSVDTGELLSNASRRARPLEARKGSMPNDPFADPPSTSTSAKSRKPDGWKGYNDVFSA